MRKPLLAALAALALAPALASAQEVGGEVIYGRDDRIDLYQVESQKIKSLASSTVALFQSGSVESQGGLAKLSLEPYGEGMSLCQDEPFWEQKNGAFCSGSLVAPDVIMTAGHCVTSQSACEGIKFVFGWGITDKAAGTPESVPAGEVYGCRKLLGREQVGTGADWALVKLDRPVAGHQPLKLNRTGKIVNGTPLFVIGHPAGLPTKVAGGAKVRDDSKQGYVVANLDTYGGNSGSAVFNARSGLVEGILVRGENDYVWRGSCRVSNKCDDDACRGEDVTRVSAVLPTLPTPILFSEAAAKKISDWAEHGVEFDGGSGR